mgnify:FL=1
MRQKINTRFLRNGSLSSFQELYDTYPINQDSDLIDVAEFITCIPLICPSRFLFIGVRHPYPHIELDSYNINILRPTKVEIIKCNKPFITNTQKAIDFLRQCKSAYPYSFTTSKLIELVVPRLIGSAFFIRKVDNSMTIEYH